jgi:hypothetical protein
VTNSTDKPIHADLTVNYSNQTKYSEDADIPPFDPAELEHKTPIDDNKIGAKVNLQTDGGVEGSEKIQFGGEEIEREIEALSIDIEIHSNRVDIDGHEVIPVADHW